MKKQLLFLSLTLFVVSQLKAQTILPLKDQAKLINEINNERINTLIPQLMESNHVDMWVIVSREYNEDPILKTLLPAEWLSARRRTIIVFYNQPEQKVYKKLAIARYKVGDQIEASWDTEKFPNQWDQLADIIKTLKPNTIALNFSKDFGHADGLDYTDYQEFIKSTPMPKSFKIVSASNLGAQWLETRTAREIQFYPQLQTITHNIIKEGFSNKVITPGITTTDDLVWWYRQKVNDLGLSTWFHPSVEIQRNDSAIFDHLSAFSNVDKANIIQPGDLLHVDFGISYLRLNSDIQEHAYVLQLDETDAPDYLKKGLQTANRLQDILTSQFAENRTGNEILKNALEQTKQESIQATIYTHPIGFHGHAAGPTIGLWDQQNGVPGSGDFPMHYNTCYSIELNAAVDIKEWNKKVRFMLEQNGLFDKNGFHYLDGRQTTLHLIGRKD